MDLGLKGRVAVVAAGSKGLGRAIAHELAAEGAAVLLFARGGAALEEARAAIARETGAEVRAVTADVTRLEDLARVAAEAHAWKGRVDVLVNNAGGPPSGPFEEQTWDRWSDAIDLTLRSAIELTRLVLPGMRERGWGRILNVTSVAVKQPVDGLVLSNALRAAVTGWARTLANEVAKDGITVNNLLPGYTRTDRVAELAKARAAREGVTPAEIDRRQEAAIPMGRMGDPREFGALAAFMASERASYITAQNVAVDGGLIRGLL